MGVYECMSVWGMGVCVIRLVGVVDSWSISGGDGVCGEVRKYEYMHTHTLHTHTHNPCTHKY